MLKDMSNVTPPLTPLKPPTDDICEAHYAIISPNAPKVNGVYKAGELKSIAKEHKDIRFWRRPSRDAALCHLNDVLRDSPLKPADEPAAAPKPGPDAAAFKDPKDVASCIRRVVNDDDVNGVYELFERNPLYVVTTNDGPPLAHPGTRRTVTHWCAQRNKSDVLSAFLDIVQSGDPFLRLYPQSFTGPDAQMAALRDRVAHCEDMYVNLPDKIANDTPLHMAAAYGSVDVCRLLCARDYINMEAFNSHGERPIDVVCSKVALDSSDLKTRKDAISAMLGVFVPIFRSPSNDWALPKSPVRCFEKVLDHSFGPQPGEIIVGECGSYSKSSSSFTGDGPDRSDGGFRCTAVAGPFNKEDGQKFLDNLRSPRYWRRRSRPSKEKASFDPVVNRLTTWSYNIEECAHVLSEDMQRPLVEQLPFGPVDLRTNDGLHKLNDELRQRHKDTGCGCMLCSMEKPKAEEPPPNGPQSTILEERAGEDVQQSGVLAPMYLPFSFTSVFTMLSSYLPSWRRSSNSAKTLPTQESRATNAANETCSESFLDAFDAMKISSPQSSRHIFFSGVEWSDLDKHIYHIVCERDLTCFPFLKRWVKEYRDFAR